MALEDLTGAKFIDSLVAGNPVSNDDRREGDDHIRGIKNVIRNTFPNVNGAVSATEEQLNAAGAISGGAFPGDVSVAGNLSVVGTGTFGGSVQGANFYVGSTAAALGAFGVPVGLGSAVIAYGDSSAGAGRLELVTAGVQRLTIDAAGKVGIGVAPTAPLDILKEYVSLHGAAYNFAFGDGPALIGAAPAGDVGLRCDTGGISFATGGFASRMRIDAAGKVGIGVTPAFQLHVGGPGVPLVRVQSTNPADFPGYTIGTAGDATSYGALQMQVTTGELRHTAGFATWGGFQTFYTNGLERLRIAAAGTITQKDGLAIASDPGAAAGTVPIGGMVLAGAPGGTNVNGLATVNAATTPLTLFATGTGANGTVNAGTFRNCGALSSSSTVALWVRTA